jgi:hypothetical protein
VSPNSVNVPATLKTVAFIEKDTKRFPDTHGWAYASSDYDAATDSFKPASLDPSGAQCGFACHTTVSARLYFHGVTEALCHADLDAGSANETARTCMSQRGYALVRKDQAEEVRAAYATAAQKRPNAPNDAAR